jgi:ATP-dependent DNA helicase PIF1
MLIHTLGRFSIQVRLLGGDFNSQLRTIPRIKLQSTDQQLSFTLSRKQFPIALCFAMTINKSQGQSFEAVGVDLRSPVFTHGQFYVAASRVTSKAGLCVLLPPNTNKTSNVVI